MPNGARSHYEASQWMSVNHRALELQPHSTMRATGRLKSLAWSIPGSEHVGLNNERSEQEEGIASDNITNEKLREPATR
jgi:hypothetical protein